MKSEKEKKFLEIKNTKNDDDEYYIKKEKEEKKNTHTIISIEEFLHSV